VATVSVRSFAKINFGLSIGKVRPDGFHELRTVYQTIGLHDVIRVEVIRGSGIEIRCTDSRVPTGELNTCHRIAQSTVEALKARGRVVVEIEKRLPVQGGLGGASSNAVATMLALERALKKGIPGAEKLRIAAEVGSDLPLFLVGGTILGVGRGEEVYPLPDLPSLVCVVATPEIGVSTPQAFADWDVMSSRRAPEETQPFERAPGGEKSAAPESEKTVHSSGKSSLTAAGLGQLTAARTSARMSEVGRRVSSWLSGLSGVSASSRGRAETLLLDLVRTGIENDFEQVVFPKHPELREVKRVLGGAGAFYASLSGSGSSLFGLFRSRGQAEKAIRKLSGQGVRAAVTGTLTRTQYRTKMF
jgi:4-diphosphocytidyl-2-C-methyl-D-erythritol kinase